MSKRVKLKNFYKRSSKIRLDVVEMLYAAQSGHSGPSLSIVEILNYLFFDTIEIILFFPKVMPSQHYTLFFTT